MLDVYMFHYVGSNIDYPHFDIKEFEKIIIKIKQDKEFIDLKDLSKLLMEKEPTKKYIIFTFDDGTIDHYQNVYPILLKHKIPAIFFISSNIFKKEILDIHKIHRLIMNVGIEKLYSQLINILKELNISYCNFEFEKKEYASYKEVFIKEILQKKLSKYHTKKILASLLQINNIELNFDDIYINLKNIKEMQRNGYQFGLHTENHLRLSSLSKNQQYKEVFSNYEYFKKNNLIVEEISISYPFGSYDENTIEILKELNIDYGFGIQTNNSNKYEIKRLDCNELKEV